VAGIFLYIVAARIIYLLKTYLLTVLLFIVAKLSFMLYNSGSHDFAATDVADVIYHGLSLDLSTSLYLFIVPFLFVVATLWLRLPTWILKSYYVLLAVVLSLTFVADTCLYEFWQFKLDASCLQYLSTPTEAMASVSGWFLLVRLLVLLAVGVVVYLAYSWLVPVFPVCRHRLAGSIGALLMVPLIVIGIRGGLAESTTNIGQVYYSQHPFLNHSAVNPLFSFMASFEKSANHIVDYDYYSDSECRQLVGEAYATDGLLADTLLNTARPNIVVILMESAGSIFTQVGGRPQTMPTIDRLMDEGVYFEQCYANTWRTDRGTVCTWSGYPSFPTSSVMKMPKKTRHLPGIASTLRKQGYKTTYLYGGDINFTNMRSYLISTGFDSLVWMKDYTAEQQSTAKWGVRDDITFDTLFDLLTKPADAPKLIGYSTLSSHEPWDVPISKYDDPTLNAFYYLDQCIGRFLTRLKQTDYWQNTLVVLLPDHSIGYQGLDERSLLRNQIPVVWTGGAIKGPRRIGAICNQTDLAATLLAQLGLPFADFAFSRNVTSPNYRYPFAVHNFNNGFTVVDSTGYAVFDLDTDRQMGGQSSDAQRLERMGKAILQSTTQHLKQL